MREYTPPENTITVVSPNEVTAHINGIPVTLGPYSQIHIHPANVGLAFPDNTPAPPGEEPA